MKVWVATAHEHYEAGWTFAVYRNEPTDEEMKLDAEDTDPDEPLFDWYSAKEFEVKEN